MPRLRADRLLTLGCFHPLRRAGLGGGGARLPVLMYHSISDSAEDAVAPYYRTATSPAIFAQHMEWLRAEGWQAVGLKQGWEKFQRAGAAAGKLVAITFDDGFRDFYTAGFPVLRQHGFSATMFLPTAFIGPEPRKFLGRDCLTWGEVRELQRAGIEFGSHTVNHPRLYELDRAKIRVELEESRATMEQELGESVRSFAYPYAFPSADRAFVRMFIELLQGAGYDCNVTTRIGRVRAGDDPFTLKRLPANGADDRALLLAKLRGSYDWMTWPQDTVKKAKRLLAGRGGAPQPRPCRVP